MLLFAHRFLKTYLSEYDDDGAYGHVALGRSFALEMGSAIPAADQRLGMASEHWWQPKAKPSRRYR